MSATAVRFVRPKRGSRNERCSFDEMYWFVPDVIPRVRVRVDVIVVSSSKRGDHSLSVREKNEKVQLKHAQHYQTRNGAESADLATKPKKNDTEVFCLVLDCTPPCCFFGYSSINDTMSVTRQADTVIQQKAWSVVAAMRLMKTANKRHYLHSDSSA